MEILKSRFFKKNTALVAEKLLGCYLVRQIGNQKLIGRIVETEAYLGVKDSCCHSFQNHFTDKTKAMYLEGGFSYVYFTYGMHYCLNVVTGDKTQPEAVLIRALEPIEGISKMKKYRKKQNLKDLCSGPGKLCQAFSITKKLNAKKLTKKGELFITKGRAVKDKELDSRVGLPLHKDSAYWFLRFYIKNNPHVSVRKNQIC
ncbi:MAG: DNA-3-methyladenine glycosylase [Bdellovibrionales bacterium]|nr:DNA-3-methyladenine glycosylase [Bdellovibrionales bacterium]